MPARHTATKNVRQKASIKISAVVQFKAERFHSDALELSLCAHIAGAANDVAGARVDEWTNSTLACALRA